MAKTKKSNNSKPAPLSQDEIWTKWKAGDIHELRNTLNDMAEGENTFFEYVDAGVGYPYPTFVCGDEAVFDRYQRALIERSQASSLSD